MGARKKRNSYHGRFNEGSIVKKALKIIGGFLFIFLLYVVGSILHGSLTDFSPEEIVALEIGGSENIPIIIKDSTLSILTWNLGYAGLSAECEIFYPKQGLLRSKGHMIRPEKSITEKNINQGAASLKEIQADFYLLQEMDVIAKRSHHIPMHNQFQKNLASYGSSFATNFLVKRVPMPVLQPWEAYGDVHSGLASFFKYKPAESTRLQLPAKHKWPDRIFHLDRCLAVNRFATEWGKDLVLINLHNSAFDKDGVMKAKELEYLKTLGLTEYEKGNYVIVGGDWNQSPPFFPSDTFNKKKGIKRKGTNIAAELFPENWSYIFDPTVPTIRSSSEIFDSEKTPRGLIDFFLISPNCRALQVKGMNQDFKLSDHQPVWMEVRLQ